MEPFLKQVAAHYYPGGDIQDTCFLFPNRRSLVFFKKYLGDLVRESGAGVPLMMPPLYTINDFFYRLNHVEVTEPLRLLLELYGVYRQLNPQAEPLDEFVFWGDVLLADFDDIDKYLVDARVLLQNVQEIKDLQDGMEYLSENQRRAIDHFLSHFRDGKGALTVSEKDSGVKSKFLKLWNLLYPLYRDFNAVLAQKNLAYEGRVYRSLAARLQEGQSVVDILRQEFPQVRQYVFVGLNALNECERLLLKRMRDAGVAQFVWDYVSPEIRDPANKSSFFMERNVQDFPQAFPLDPQGLPRPEINVISVASSVGQAKWAPRILQEIAGQAGNDGEGQAGNDGEGQAGNDDDRHARPDRASIETAFVLPDETLLLPLLNSLPEEHDSVNVTMGYPMAGSAVYTLLSAIGQMQLKMRKKADGWYYYHRQVREVFSCGLVKKLSTPQEADVIRKVKAAAKYYIPLQDLQGGPLLDLLFQPVIQEPSLASSSQNHAMERYLTAIVAYIGRHLSAQGGMLLELDFAKRCHTQLTLLQETGLEVLPATHLRLLERLLESISVPFRGEPLQGLQIMGPLETRALDFRNLVILSANEGMFPRRSIRSSFIPPELRKGFGLPTYEFQDAVWAYYFYRMIQRAERVWLLYDSRTEGLKTGEESRYIKQLEYSSTLKVKRFIATSALLPVDAEGSIPKTPADVQLIREKELSASSLQSYLYCPAKFYYQVVQGLQTEEDVAESLDAGMLGNVFHRVMQKLYRGKTLVTAAHLEALQKDTARLRRLIRSEVLEQMHSIEVSGRNLVLEEVILDYVQRTLRHDAGLLAASSSAGFRIMGLEQKRRMEWNGFHFKGFVDRIDSYRNGEVRIVDYKTGRVEDDEILITDDNAAAVVDKLFGESNVHRPKIALQLFLYDLFAHADAALDGQTLVNSIYSTTRLYTGALPDCPESAEFSRLTGERLKAMLAEMTDVSVPFRRTDEPDTCTWCDFKNICGR